MSNSFQPVARLSAAQARRVALAAQGFGDGRPAGQVTLRHLQRVLKRVKLLQIDSVNVLVRAHYLPLFARLGPYAPELLERAAWGRKRLLFEYWGHEASLLPLEMQPLLRWRMERARSGQGIYGGLARFAREKPSVIEAALAEVRARGPLGAGELTDGGRGAGGWWGWSDGKTALEWLFWAGLVTTGTRRNFERLYDLPERALPPEILALPTPTAEEAHRQLLDLSAQALGVATAADLRDYYRLVSPDTKRPMEELVEAGRLLPVTVEGWSQPAFLHAEAERPRRMAARALMAPFDSLVWDRDRAERLFGFHYRIEIYTPAAKRNHGYYVLPFLLGDRLVGRVDLKADRAGSRLLVQAAHAEPGTDHALVAAELAAELALMARWLGLGELVVEPRGDLAGALAHAVG